jgi:hypothetical protein
MPKLAQMKGVPMGEHDAYATYYSARTYADEQAEKYQQGEEIDGWTYKVDDVVGLQKPKRVCLRGAAWVAHTYEMAAVQASVLVQAQGSWWQSVVEDCKRLAATYRSHAQQQANRQVLKENNTMTSKPLAKHVALHWDTHKQLLVVTTRREQLRITPDEAIELLELFSHYRDEIVTALYKLPNGLFDESTPPPLLMWRLPPLLTSHNDGKA